MIKTELFDIFYKKSLFYKFDDDLYAKRSMIELVRTIPHKAILDHLSGNISDKEKLGVMTSQINVKYTIKPLLKEKIFINQKKINEMFENIQFMYEMACIDSRYLYQTGDNIKTTLYALFLLFEREMLNITLISDLVDKYNRAMDNPSVITEDSKNIITIKDKLTKIMYFYEYILKVTFNNRKFKESIRSNCAKFTPHIAKIVNELYSDRPEFRHVVDIFRHHPMFICDDKTRFNGVSGLFGTLNYQFLIVRLAPLDFESFILNFILETKVLYTNIIIMSEFYTKLYDSCIQHCYLSTNMPTELSDGIHRNVALIESFIKNFCLCDTIVMRELIIKL